MGECFDEVVLPMMKKLVEAGKSYDEVKRLVKIPSTWGFQVKESIGQTRQESPRSRHVGSILIPKSLDQLLLFGTSAGDDHRKRGQSEESQKPVGGEQAHGDDSK
jgi:hypothetical protein